MEDQTAIVLGVQARSPTAVRGFGSGCSGGGSQLEYVLSSGFSILLLLNLTLVQALVPSISNSSVKAPLSQSTTRKPSIPLNKPAPHAMATRSALRISVTSTWGSKRSSNATSSNASRRSKRQKVDGAPPADLYVTVRKLRSWNVIHNGLRSHVINALVTDDTIQLLYYDRPIILVSRPVNFLADPSRFVVTLHAIANLSLPQLGYAEVLKLAPLLDNPRQTTNVFDGLELKLNDGAHLELGSTISYMASSVVRHVWFERDVSSRRKTMTSIMTLGMAPSS